MDIVVEQELEALLGRYPFEIDSWDRFDGKAIGT
jgi:hypothetical protein